MKVFFALLLASFCIASSFADNVTYVYGPDTPIYYPKMIERGLKVNMIKSNFPGNIARNTRNSNALFPRLLIVGGYDSFAAYSESGFLSKARAIIDGINSYFAAIGTNRSVEVMLGGVVLMKTPDVYEPTDLQNFPDSYFSCRNWSPVFPRGNSKLRYHSKAYCRQSDQELNRFAAWFKDKEDQFEDLNAHIILYISQYYLSANDTENMKLKLVTGVVQREKFVCSTKPVVLVSGLFGDSNIIYAKAVSYTLGVDHDSNGLDIPCSSKDVSDVSSKTFEWNEKAKAKINQMDFANKYSCIKPSSPDYDD